MYLEVLASIQNIAVRNIYEENKREGKYMKACNMYVYNEYVIRLIKADSTQRFLLQFWK